MLIDFVILINYCLFEENWLWLFDLKMIKFFLNFFKNWYLINLYFDLFCDILMFLFESLGIIVKLRMYYKYLMIFLLNEN